MHASRNIPNVLNIFHNNKSKAIKDKFIKEHTLTLITSEVLIIFFGVQWSAIKVSYIDKLPEFRRNESADRLEATSAKFL